MAASIKVSGYLTRCMVRECLNVKVIRVRLSISYLELGLFSIEVSFRKDSLKGKECLGLLMKWFIKVVLKKEWRMIVKGY
jgi:hypothetical protein